MQNYDSKKREQTVKSKNTVKPINFTRLHDFGHSEPATKSYLAFEKDKQQNARKNNSDGMIMLDIFGALNY